MGLIGSGTVQCGFSTSQNVGKNWGFLDGLVRARFVGKLRDCY